MPGRRRDVSDLAMALYSLSALQRDLQRLAGIEHAVAALTALGVVNRIGPARVSDVASALDINLSVASRRIQALEDSGYVDRVADPDDGRCSLIAISPAGTSKLQAAHDRIVDALAGALADWSGDDVAGLADGFVRLRSALVEHDPARSASPAAPPESPIPREAESHP